MDFFADNMVKHIIGEIISNKDNIKDNKNIWKSYTKLMFKNYPAYQVYNWVHEALEEASEDQWFEYKYSEKDFNDKFVEIDVPNNPIKSGYLKKKKIEKGEFIPSYEMRMVHDKLTFKQLLDHHNIEHKGEMALCPFHDDTNRSLNFSEDKKLWNCHGCDASGSLYKLVKMLEEVKNVKG
jgi:aminoglycoside N3'-acetyltransferase|tara:strand:- start:660 stop:1199 length:540 start_codon:yes stop_codon:yes gene_type:complete